MDKPQETDKKTWYSLHKEQIKLIQFLMYHLNKHKKQEKKVEIKEADFVVKFD